MAITVYFANIAKKRNSTLQGTFTDSKDVVLKAPTSIDRPTFLVSAAAFDYNAAKWGDRYYFITDVVSVRAGQWEVSCILDVLATYKTDILASTQYVCYSSQNGDTWLADTRIPVKKSATVDHSQVSPSVFSSIGFYALTVTGKTGTEVFALDESDIKALIADINTWANDLVDGINDGTLFGINYDFSTPQDALESLAYITSQTGVLGNSYANAPQNIRSCLWLPLSKSQFVSGSKRIYLGNWDTGITADQVKIGPVSDSFTISIPWQRSDWRRAVCESLLLYLPFAGCINIPVDLVINETTLTIRWSISATDGTIAYFVYGGSNNIIGTYGGTLGANYAIGINQQSSLGEVVQTAYNGLERTVSAAINTSISPFSIAAGIAGVAMNGANTAYEVADVMMSTHPTTIGNFGGCTGIGLTLGVVFLISVAHDTIISPASMAATMGRPTMKPLTLSTLSGFCQCANAHVAAAAQAEELDAIDSYLNSGFFIE